MKLFVFKPNLSEDMQLVYNRLTEMGTVYFDISEIESLWEEFSYDTMMARYLIPTDELITEFAYWLESHNDEEEEEYE